MPTDLATLLTIAGMAIVTYMTRIAGFWMVRRIRLGARAGAALAAVPGSILIALVTPMAATTGIAETAGAILTLLLASRLPALAAIAGGVVAVALLRLVLH